MTFFDRAEGFDWSLGEDGADAEDRRDFCSVGLGLSGRRRYRGNARP